MLNQLQCNAVESNLHQSNFVMLWQLLSSLWLEEKKKKICWPKDAMDSFSHEGAGLRGNEVLYVAI